MNMGEKIKLLRQSKNMTLEDLGKKVGVGKSTVRKWEQGIIANMRQDKISKIAIALNVTPAYLMGWEENLTADNAYLQVEILERPDILKLNKKLLNESEEFVSQVDSYVDFIIEQKNKD